MSKTQLPPKIADFVNNWRHKKGNLIMVLHAVQDHYGYVPKDICFKLSQELKVPLARIYEVITFYNYFNLQPPGRYKISVCLGTACYLKGAPQLVDTIKRELKLKEGQTSEDGHFRFEVVRCLGCCGLAPVVMVNDKIYGKVTPKEMSEIIDRYRKEG